MQVALNTCYSKLSVVYNRTVFQVNKQKGCVVT